MATSEINWPEHLTLTEEMQMLSSITIFKKNHNKVLLGGSEVRRKHIIKMHLIPKHDVSVLRRWEAVVNTVMNLLVPQSAGNILTM
jgi:hypothetical protein